MCSAKSGMSGFSSFEPQTRCGKVVGAENTNLPPQVHRIVIHFHHLSTRGETRHNAALRAEKRRWRWQRVD
jgi:hypothetical protein